MSDLDDWRHLADQLRGDVPESLVVRNDRVIVRTVKWSGGSIKFGDPTVTDVELDPRPEVQETSGGQALRVGPITPAYTVGASSGGYAYADLWKVDPACGEERYYVVIGANGERFYALTDIDTSRDLGWTIVLQTMSRKGPF